MKQIRMHFCITLFVMLITTLLSSCTSPSYHRYDVNTDLLAENWLPKMKVSPRMWVAHTDPWFYSGSPSQITRYAMRAPMGAAMSDTTIRVPDFTNVVINGNFQVQIVGNQEHNSVSILGPNAMARNVAVDVNEHTNTIIISQIPDTPILGKNVIVRIGMRNLRKLAVNGSGSLVGRGITSDHLDIRARGCATILLSGYMNVTTVLACDSAVVSILGACAPCLKVKSVGHGTINIQGRVGIQSIINLGVGSITITGADSDRLAINAAGGSTTRVIGVVNLKSIVARQFAKVYIYCVMSRNVRVRIMDNAYVGLAGRAGVLAADLTECGFLAAKTLCANIGYIQACNYAHANVRVQQRLFAKSVKQGSIYFLGPPDAVSRFTSGYGIVLPISTNGIASPPFPYHEVTSWRFTGAQANGAFATGFERYYP